MPTTYSAHIFSAMRFFGVCALKSFVSWHPAHLTPSAFAKVGMSFLIVSGVSLFSGGGFSGSMPSFFRSSAIALAAIGFIGPITAGAVPSGVAAAEPDALGATLLAAGGTVVLADGDAPGT